ncbi:hypothetical protein BJ322DRAFT_1018433 [Thelephora terrestris]|uniref:Uncharacterized protein n=1 Tax=Thelephora terrestris TaxID=56493 RepID=A0A9P6LAT9_9AGAM|nr:hypothetical protein BJ322DRAFT_1018433 [Thelephora terrestris]
MFGKNAATTANKGGGFGLLLKEQITPTNAILAEESANEQTLDPVIMPPGIMTLGDILKGMCAKEPSSAPSSCQTQMAQLQSPWSELMTLVMVTQMVFTSHTFIGSELRLRHGPTIIKPITLKAMEGFGLFASRSRSVLLIQREQARKSIEVWCPTIGRGQQQQPV